MPPRPALPIFYQTPLNGVDPPGPGDFDADLPLRFTRGELRWRKIVPFLQWADEAVPRGSLINYSTVSFFEIEALLMDTVDITALRAEYVVDTTLAVSAVFRILNFIRLQGWFSEASPCSSYEHFIRTVRSNKLTLSPTELSIFTIRPIDVCKFLPRVVAYSLDHRWLQLWTWEKARDREGRLTTTMWILKLLGSRASLASRAIGSRLTSIAARFGAAFIRNNAEFTFTEQELAAQVPVWVRAFKYPSELSVTPVDEAEALSEFLRAYRFSQASPADKSTMVADVFDKVLVATPSLAKLAGDADPLQAYHAFRPLLKTFEITSDPLLSDWLTLDSRVAGMLEIVASMPLAEDLLSKRVNMIIEDEKATNRGYTGKLDVARVPGEVDGFTASIDPTSITLLRRSAQLQKIVQKLSQEMAKASPKRNKVIRICLRSQLSGVVRYIVGAVDTLQVHEVFGQITHYRAQKLHVSTLDTISKALWLAVFKDDIVDTPRLKNCSFSNRFTYQLLTGDWASIDFEQRLLFDVNAARSGQTYNNTNNRSPKLWLLTEHDLGDLMVPISKLFCLLGYPEAMHENSCAAVLGRGIEGFRHARAYPLTADTIQSKSRQMLQDAFKDAQGSWSSFFRDKSAAAPFPVTWLSLESTCDMSLEAAKKSSRTFNDWTADLGGLMNTAPLMQPPPAQPKGKLTPAEELAKITADNKRLREEITKQSLANKKAKGRTPLDISTCLHCIIWQCSMCGVSATTSVVVAACL